MRKHFNSATRQSLNTRVSATRRPQPVVTMLTLTHAITEWAPSAMELYRATSKFARQIDEYFGERVPEINASPILWKLIRSMGGSREPILVAPASSCSALAHTILLVQLGSTPLLSLSAERSTYSSPCIILWHRTRHATISSIRRPSMLVSSGETTVDHLSCPLWCSASFSSSWCTDWTVVTGEFECYSIDRCTSDLSLLRSAARVPVNDEDPATTMMAKADWLRWLQQEKAAREKTPSLGVLGRGEMCICPVAVLKADAD